MTFCADRSATASMIDDALNEDRHCVDAGMGVLGQTVWSGEPFGLLDYAAPAGAHTGDKPQGLSLRLDKGSKR